MKYLLSLTIVLFSFLSTAQELDSLKLLKKELISQEKFDKIQGVQNQIDVLEFYNDYNSGKYVTKINSEIKKAVEVQDYAKAQELKNKKDAYSKIVKQDSLISIALKNEDYSQAHQYKVERDQMINTLLDINNVPTSNENSTPSKTVATEVIVEKEISSNPSQNIIIESNKNLYGFKLRWGLSLGAIKFKTTKIQPETKYTPLVGLRLGLDYDTKLFVDYLSFETGLTFSFTQYKLDIPQLISKINYQTFYVGTQFLVNFRFANDRLAIGTGPFFDIGYYGRQKIEKGETYNLFKGNDLQTEAPFKRLNVGLELKANYNFGKSKRAGLYLSFRKGLKNLENIDAPSGVNQSVKTWLISFGLKARLSK